MKMRKLLCLLLSLVLVLSLAACGESGGKKEKSGKTPESVAEKYMDAVLDADFEKIFDLIHKDVINNGLEAEGLDKEYLQEMIDENNADMEEMFAELEEEAGGKVKFSYEVLEAEELSEDMLENGQEYYEDEYDVKITDAKVVEIEVTVEFDGDQETESFEIYVVKIGGSWYLDIDSVSNFSYLFY